MEGKRGVREELETKHSKHFTSTISIDYTFITKIENRFLPKSSVVMIFGP
jgi:hypothetical protein